MSFEKESCSLESVVSSNKLEGVDVFLLKYSRLVDSVDMFLGPFSEFAKFSDSQIILGAGFLSGVVKGVIKIPFISLYLVRTKDFSALYDWVPKEVFSYAAPLGSFIDVLRSYEKITFTHYGLKPFSKIPSRSKSIELNKNIFKEY